MSTMETVVRLQMPSGEISVQLLLKLNAFRIQIHHTGSTLLSTTSSLQDTPVHSPFLRDGVTHVPMTATNTGPTQTIEPRPCITSKLQGSLASSLRLYSPMPNHNKPDNQQCTLHAQLPGQDNNSSISSPASAPQPKTVTFPTALN